MPPLLLLLLLWRAKAFFPSQYRKGEGGRKGIARSWVPSRFNYLQTAFFNFNYLIASAFYVFLMVCLIDG